VLKSCRDDDLALGPAQGIERRFDS